MLRPSALCILVVGVLVGSLSPVCAESNSGGGQPLHFHSRRLLSEPPTPAPTPGSSSAHTNELALGLGITGGLLLVICVGLCWWWRCRRARWEKFSEESQHSIMLGREVQFKPRLVKTSSLNAYADNMRVPSNTSLGTYTQSRGNSTRSVTSVSHSLLVAHLASTDSPSEIMNPQSTDSVSRRHSDGSFRISIGRSSSTATTQLLSTTDERRAATSSALCSPTAAGPAEPAAAEDHDEIARSTSTVNTGLLGDRNRAVYIYSERNRNTDDPVSTHSLDDEPSHSLTSASLSSTVKTGSRPPRRKQTRGRRVLKSSDDPGTVKRRVQTRLARFGTLDSYGSQSPSEASRMSSLLSNVSRLSLLSQTEWSVSPGGTPSGSWRSAGTTPRTDLRSAVLRLQHATSVASSLSTNDSGGGSSGNRGSGHSLLKHRRSDSAGSASSRHRAKGKFGGGSDPLRRARSRGSASVAASVGPLHALRSVSTPAPGVFPDVVVTPVSFSSSVSTPRSRYTRPGHSSRTHLFRGLTPEVSVSLSGHTPRAGSARRQRSRDAEDVSQYSTYTSHDPDCSATDDDTGGNPEQSVSESSLALSDHHISLSSGWSASPALQDAVSPRSSTSVSVSASSGVVVAAAPATTGTTTTKSLEVAANSSSFPSSLPPRAPRHANRRSSPLVIAVRPWPRCVEVMVVGSKQYHVFYNVDTGHAVVSESCGGVLRWPREPGAVPVLPLDDELEHVDTRRSGYRYYRPTYDQDEDLSELSMSLSTSADIEEEEEEEEESEEEEEEDDSFGDHDANEIEEEEYFRPGSSDEDADWDARGTVQEY